jgi:glycosyltransferase involved in cell wall biosynthesis
LFAIGTLGIGGSENQLTQFLARAHPEHLDGTVVTWWDSPPDLPNEQLLSAAGVERRRIGFPGMPRVAQAPLLAWRGDRLLRELQPDLVYCWLESPSLLFGASARALRIPVIVARRNIEGAPIERVPALGSVIRRAEQMATLATGNSEAVIATAVRRGIPAARMRLVRNGHPPMPPLPPPDGDTVLLGYVAAFRREKGHLRLLDVLSRVTTEVPWRIDLAGEGPLLKQVKRLMQRRGLSDRVRCVGVVRDVRSFWRDHHVDVFL